VPTFVRLRQFLFSAPKAVIYFLAGGCMAAVAGLVWRAESFRKRFIILGCMLPVCGALAALFALTSSTKVDAPSEPGIGIRREANRLFAQTTETSKWPISAVLPPVAGELVPESETRFSERLSGRPVIFSQDARGNVTGFAARTHGRVISYEKTSDQLPENREPLKPRVAIKLDPVRLDACVGRYEFPPDAVSSDGFKLTIWREGDQLVARAQGANVLKGAFDIYPQSETTFFVKTNGVQLTFIKNDQGKVVAVLHHLADYPDTKGKKLRDD
jgi:hypothetical protein